MPNQELTASSAQQDISRLVWSGVSQLCCRAAGGAGDRGADQPGQPQGDGARAGGNGPDYL